ncbi:MAG: riboflavin synthase [bacterium]|nr:riboflavin synthase [bacterium]
MFSGIIRSKSKIISIEPKAKGIFLGLNNKAIFNNIKLGDSLCISGVCLSVLMKKNNEVYFEVMPETLRKTTLGKKNVDEIVNIETSLQLGESISGHFVFGHVDGVGRVTKIEKEGHNILMTITPPANLLIYFCPQGSIALDGVSLTIARLNAKTFTVSLIEDTLKKTTLSKLTVGNEVNIECDMLAKYVAEQFKNLKKIKK